MAEEQREVDIPAGVLVRCPLVKFDLRAVRKCEGCEHFAGLGEQIGGRMVSFTQQFVVRCRFPYDRNLFQLESD